MYLSVVVAMVGSIKHECVVQLAQFGQGVHHGLHTVIHAHQRLEALDVVQVQPLNLRGIKAAEFSTAGQAKVSINEPIFKGCKKMKRYRDEKYRQ